MRAAVIGDPVGHSLSPVIHRAAYDGLGLDWTYEAVVVPSGTLAEHLDSLDPTQWRGLSLTMPLKREVLPLLTSRDPWVELSGAANTLVLDPDGSRHGYNTDITGAMSLLERHDPVRTALVLGAGATAASVLLALAEKGLETATLVVRDPDRAVETVRVVSGHPARPALEVITVDELGLSVSADVVVSTVPASAQTIELVAALADVPLVFDVVYDPWPTPLMNAAERFGQRLISGLDLLLAQAVGQVRAMTGRDDVPAERMRSAAEEVVWSR
jgi:shikimate dehydrogenase